MRLLRLGASSLGMSGIVALLATGAALAEDPGRKKDAAARRTERARRQVEALVGRVGPVERLHASWNLEALAPESVDVLLEALKLNKPEEDGTVAAFHVLGELCVAKALPALEAVALAEKEPLPVRLTAVLAIAKFLDGDSRKALARIAEAQPGAPVGRAALLALARTDDRGIVPRIEKSLEAKDPATRAAALRAIGHLREAKLLPKVVAALDADESLAVRAQAARALGRLGDAAQLEKLDKVFPRLAEGPLRVAAAEALARAGKASGLDALAAYVERDEGLTTLAAATALLEVATATQAPLLRGVLEKTLDKKLAPGADLLCVAAIGAIGDRDAVPLLVRALKAPRPELQREAAATLGVLGDERAAKPLLEALRADRRLVPTALVALARLGGKKLWAAELRTALKDRDPVIRYAACAAIEVARDAVPEARPLLEDANDFVARAAEDALGPGRRQGGRDPLHLERLRALETELLMRLPLEDLAQALPQNRRELEIEPLALIEMAPEPRAARFPISHLPAHLAGKIVRERLAGRVSEIEAEALKKKPGPAATEEDLEEAARRRRIVAEAKHLLRSQ